MLPTDAAPQFQLIPFTYKINSLVQLTTVYVHTIYRFDDFNIKQFGSGKNIIFVLPFHCEWYENRAQ